VLLGGPGGQGGLKKICGGGGGSGGTATNSLMNSTCECKLFCTQRASDTCQRLRLKNPVITAQQTAKNRNDIQINILNY